MQDCTSLQPQPTPVPQECRAMTTRAARHSQPLRHAGAGFAAAAALWCGAAQAAPISWIGTAPSSAASATTGTWLSQGRPPSQLQLSQPQLSQLQLSQLQLQVSSRAHVFYEPKPWQPDDPAPSAAGLPAPRASLGLGFKTAPGNAAGVKGLLRVQLTSDSALHFRPRGGGMTVTYKSQF